MAADPRDSAATVVYSTSTPSICGFDGCQCCPPGATFCECHDCYECGEIDCDCT